MGDEYVAEDTELRLTIKTRSIPLCRCPTLKPRLMTVWIDRSSKVFDVKKKIQTDFCKAHEGITTARMSLAYPPAKDISQTWRDLDDDCAFDDYGIVNSSTLVLTLKDAEEYAEPMNKVGDDYWRYFADDHALTEVPPSALAARTAKPKRLRHREMMDGKGIPPLEGDEEEDGEGDEDGSDGSDYGGEYAEEA